MKLKRLFDDEKRATRVQILHLSPEWHVSPRIVAKGTSEGWMSMGKGALTLHTDKGDVVFDIVRAPNPSAEKPEDRLFYFDCRVRAKAA